MILCPPKPAAPIDLNAPGAASHAPAAAGSHGGVRHLLQARLARGFPRQSLPSNHSQCFRPTPAYTSIRGDNGRLMSSEWSSIVSTLAEDDSSNGALRTAHKQSEGPRRYAYDQAAMLGDPLRRLGLGIGRFNGSTPFDSLPSATTSPSQRAETAINDLQWTLNGRLDTLSIQASPLGGDLD